MAPELRAILDRFMVDWANVKYIATTLPKGGLDAEVPGLEWNVRQLLAHIAASLEHYARSASAFAKDGTRASDFDPEAFNGETAEAAKRTPLPAILGRADRAINSLFETFGALPDDAGDRPYGHLRFADELHAWSLHCIEHGMDLVDALPATHEDPMVLNWILYADFDDDPPRLARQQRLLEEVRDRLAEQGDDWDEDDWDEGEADAP